MQERPIVYLLAKCLWRRGYEFELEDQKHDLSLNNKRIEFKFNYALCEKALKKELVQYGDNLKGMWELVQARKISRTRGVMARIYEDVCVKKPRIFVWIVCSRDLSKVAPRDLKRIIHGPAQFKYNAAHPYSSSGKLPMVADFLNKLQSIRPFSLLEEDIQTNGDFPATYHFRICYFV